MPKPAEREGTGVKDKNLVHSLAKGFRVLEAFTADEAELPQKILHHYLPTFDNCNHVSQEISDLLCQASSGMGFSSASCSRIWMMWCIRLDAHSY